MKPICAINWPYRRTARFIIAATRQPHERLGASLQQRIFDKPGGTVLATWTSAQGYLTAAAGGRIVWNVPASAMAAPLTAGTFPFDLLRTDASPPEVVLEGFIKIAPEPAP